MHNLKTRPFLILIISTLILYSCGNSNESTNQSNSSGSSSESYYSINEGYIVGEEISIWRYIGGKNNTANIEPLVTIKAPSSRKVEVITLVSRDTKSISSKEVIDELYGTGWITVKFSNESESQVGYVDYKNVYSDPKGKILFAVLDAADQSITINPPNYSTSKYLSPSTYYGPYSTSYDSRNESRKKYCDLLDAALVLASANSAKRGEFETQEEFRNRVKATKLLANMTKWNEKIYTSFRKISGNDFAYNVDSQIMTAEIFGPYHGVNTLHTGASYSSDKSMANMVGLSFDLEREGTFGGCPAEYNEGIEFVVNKTSFGKFKISICPDSYSSYACSGVKIKMDREAARVTKESGVYKLIYGLRPSKVSSARQWSERRKKTWGDGGYYNVDKGAFKFEAEVLYIFLVNESGKLMQSYTTSEYINNYLENDLYIQTNAYENRKLIPEIEKLTDKEKITKLLWNRMKQDK